MSNSVRLATASAILSLFLVSAPLGAAGGGGGGGGGMPSDSAPQYDPVAEYQKGVAALQASRFGEAKRAFDRVLAVAPKDANTAYMAGLASDGLAKPKDARKYYDKALRSDKAHVEARQGLALALVKLGEPAKAQAELDNLKTAAATCASACPSAAKLAAAVQAVSAALAGQQAATPPLPPRVIGSAGNLPYGEAVALINLHRYDAALASLYRAGEAFGPHPDVLTYLGFTHRKLGQPDRAEDYYRQALAVAPDHRGALEYYGELKVERGDLAGARANLARLETICRFGCYEAEELRRWIAAGPPAAG